MAKVLAVPELFGRIVAAEADSSDEDSELVSGSSGPQPKDRRRKDTYNPLLLDKSRDCFFDFSSTYGLHRRYTSFGSLPWGAAP